MKTTRRMLIGRAAGLAAAGLSAPAIAQGRTEWRMVTAWPPALPGVGVGAERLAARIGELTDGRLSIRVYPVGDLMPGQENMQAVMDGHVQMSHDMASYYLAKLPALAFFASVPFGLTAQEHNAWIMSGGGQGLWDEVGERFGLRVFLAGNLGAELGGWFRKEITTPGDLEGLRFRITGLAGQALSRLGVTQILLPGAATVDKLRAGERDAAEFMGLVNDRPFGFQDVAKILYWPGFHKPCAAVQLQVNAEAFGALSKSDQAVVAAACGEENGRLLADYQAVTPAALARLTGEDGVELRQLPPAVFQAFGRAVGEVLGELTEAGDDLVKRIARSYFGFRDSEMLWTRLGDQAFTNMRLLDYPYPKGS